MTYNIRYIYIPEGKNRQQRKYYYYDAYDSWTQAITMAKYIKKKEGVRHKIFKGNIETFLGFPKEKYLLFFERYKPLWS